MPQPAAPAFTALLFSLSGCLVDFGARSHAHAEMSPTDAVAAERAQTTPGALEILRSLRQQGVPCAWLDELPTEVSQHLAAPLPSWVAPINSSPAVARWPAPDACWQALMALKVNQVQGCVLVSGEPRLLQAGLNAGLWTIGLASCGPLCGLSASQWQALSRQDREYRRGQATLQLFRLGVHSVIDHLEELSTCLADIGQRRLKGEKP